MERKQSMTDAYRAKHPGEFSSFKRRGHQATKGDRQRRKVTKCRTRLDHEAGDAIDRKAARERSQGICEICGQRPAVEMHHVRGKRSNPKLRHVHENHLDSCFECHVPTAHNEVRAFHVWFCQTFPDRAETIGLTAYLRMRGETL